MAKTCKSCGRSPVWAKDLCKGCQWKRPDIKKFINSKSTKRKEDEKRQLEQNKRNQQLQNKRNQMKGF